MPAGKYYTERVNCLVLISKEEALILNGRGIKFHRGICTSYTRHKKYYLVESESNLQMLKELREESKSKGLTQYS